MHLQHLLGEVGVGVGGDWAGTPGHFRRTVVEVITVRGGGGELLT